jgi:hypothetical protein
MPYFSYFPKREYQFSGRTTKNVTDISKYAAIFSRIADEISFYTYYPVRPGERLDVISYKFYDTVNFYWTIPLINPQISNTWSDLPRSYRNLNTYVKRKYPGTALLVRSDKSLAGLFKIGETIENSVNDETATVIEIKPTLGYIVIDQETGDFPLNVEFDITGRTGNSTTTIRDRVPHHLAPAYFQDNDGNRLLYDSVSIPTTLQEQEFQLNESLSPIKVIRPEFISTVVRRFEDEMDLRLRN